MQNIDKVSEMIEYFLSKPDPESQGIGAILLMVKGAMLSNNLSGMLAHVSQFAQQEIERMNREIAAMKHGLN